MQKTETDRYWSGRASSQAQDVHVNIGDVHQRELEYDQIFPHLMPTDRLLEVGCGMGFSTERFRSHVKHVDAFDYSEEMVDRARRTYGERNNRFFVDSVLDPRNLAGPYDSAVCVRVLINLRNLDEQILAIGHLADALRPGGLLVLAEGFREGFEAINELREHIGLPGLTPAKINFYSRVEDLAPTIDSRFEREAEFHLGAYDYLTRVVYPAAVGPENARANTDFSERCERLARALNPDDFAHLSRVRGFVLRRRA